MNRIQSVEATRLTALTAMLLGVAFLLSPARADPATRPVDPVTAVRALASSGDDAGAVAAVDRLLADLPTGADVAGWRLPLGYFTDDAYLGSRYGYVVGRTLDVPWQAGEGRPELPPIDPLPLGLGASSDANLLAHAIPVTCVDLATGRALWTRLLPTRTRVALDPLDDALWAWNVFEWADARRLAPADGSATTRPFPPEPKLRPNRRDDRWDVRGLVVDGRHVWSRQVWPGSDSPISAWEADLNAGTRAQQVRPALLHAPAGRAYLSVGGGEADRDKPGSPPGYYVDLSRPESRGDNTFGLWQHDPPGVLRSFPAWLPTDPAGPVLPSAIAPAKRRPKVNAQGGDALLLSGEADGPGFVRRLNGVSGDEVWTYQMDATGYVPGTVGGRLWASVGPVDVAGRGTFVAALGTDGRAVLLDPATGERAGVADFADPPAERQSARPVAFLDLPRAVNGRLVAVHQDALRAVPLSDVFGTSPGTPEATPDADGPTVEARLLAVRSRSLLALGRSGEATDTARRVTSLAPSDADGWRLLGDALDASAGADEAVAPRVEAMRLSGAEHDDDLMRTHGLAWRLATGPVRAPLAPMGPVLVVAPLDAPELIEVDALGLSVVSRPAADYGADSLWLVGDALWRSRGKPEIAGTFAVAPRPSAGPVDGSPDARGWPTIHPNDPLLWNVHRHQRPAGGPQVDWGQRTIADPPPTPVVGPDGCERLVCPTPGGGSIVYELSASRRTESPPLGLPSLAPDPKLKVSKGRPPGRPWAIEPLPGRSLGYGPGGVFLLDAQDRPASVLIETDAPVVLLAADADQTRLAIVVAPPQEAPRLQVWKAVPDPGEVGPPTRYERVRDVPATPGPDTFGPVPGRLIRLSASTAGPGGFLVSGRDLTFASDDDARPAWRFDLNLADDANPMSRDRANDFGVARVVGDHVFVAGGSELYAIELARLRGG